MNDEESVRGMVTELLSDLELDPTEIIPADTIGDRPPMVVGGHDASHLPTIVTRTGVQEPVEIELGEKIGEGGMGVVQLGVQKALRREVAVKRLRQDRRGESAARELLEEAWLLGALEHPNIVPVYTLGEDEAGSPIVVMKRIEGISWLELLHSPGHPFGPTDEDDALVWQIERLIDVCHAVQFAHSREIIHRDIKPENVMIGEFGEVYLLDWGLAVALEDDGTGRFALASDQTSFAGTPVYAAPEMIDPAPSRLCRQTDVYLLGATLHEIVTGEPRHRGENIYDIMFQARRSAPYDYRNDVPSELARICNRATARRPSDRFPTVDAFRRSLHAFLSHRESYRLSTDATRRFARLRQAMAEGEDEIAIYNRFGACRFGFEAALQAWNENPEAKVGLSKAIRSMVEHELDNRNPRAARVLLADLDEESSQLEGRIRRLQMELDEESEEARRLQRIGEEMDYGVSARSRSFYLALMAVTWAAFPAALATGEALDLYVLEPADLPLPATLFWVFLGVILFILRDRLAANAVNRLVGWSTGVVAVSSYAILLHGLWNEVSIGEIVAFHLVIFFAVMAMVSSVVDRRLVYASVAYLVGFVLSVMFPAAALWWLSGANLVGLGAASYATLEPDALKE